MHLIVLLSYDVMIEPHTGPIGPPVALVQRDFRATVTQMINIGVNP